MAFSFHWLTSNGNLRLFWIVIVFLSAGSFKDFEGFCQVVRDQLILVMIICSHCTLFVIHMFNWIFHCHVHLYPLFGHLCPTRTATEALNPHPLSHPNHTLKGMFFLSLNPFFFSFNINCLHEEMAIHRNFCKKTYLLSHVGNNNFFFRRANKNI